MDCVKKLWSRNQRNEIEYSFPAMFEDMQSLEKSHDL